MFVMKIKLNHNPKINRNLNTLQNLKLISTIRRTEVIGALQHTLN